VSWLKPAEHQIKAAVFGLCRPFLRKRRPRLDGFNPSAVRRVLLLRPEKIGDMVISLPVFAALHRSYPTIQICVLASPRNYSLIKDDPQIDRIFLYRKRLSDLAVLRSVRAGKFDVVLDMIHGDSVTALFYSQLASRSAWHFGIGKSEHAAFYDYNGLDDAAAEEHIVDASLRLLEPFGVVVEPEDRFVPPHVRPESARVMEAFLQSCGHSPERPLIGLNLSAGRPNRIWPEESVEQLCTSLLDALDGLTLVIITTPDDRSRGERLAVVRRGAVRLVPAGLGLGEVSALISNLDLLISPDTSLIHIARSFKVPVVGLYNRARKNFRHWRPYRQPDGVVMSDHPDTIYDITPQRVFDQVGVVLSRTREAAR